MERPGSVQVAYDALPKTLREATAKRWLPRGRLWTLRIRKDTIHQQLRAEPRS